MKNAAINVSTEVKAKVEAAAKKVCGLAQAKLTEFNQDLNALTGIVVLKELGVTIPDDKKVLVMQALKKLGNSSALRQAISETKKAGGDAGEAMADELMNL